MYVNQSIQRPQGVNVFGSCLIRAQPDYASLRFAVTRIEKHPTKAFEAARAAVQSVRKFLSGEGIEEREIRTSQISLEQSYTAYPERRFLGYQTQVGFQLSLTKLERLEAILAGVVDAGANQIERVSFQTSLLRELRDKARQKAVLSALHKAEVYCSAVQAKLGDILHIEDVNPDELTRRSHAPDIDLTEHDESENSEDYGPGSIVVSAAVMACFALLR